MGTMERYRECLASLIQSLDDAHAEFYRAGTFGGPSLHFHLQALEARHDANCQRFADRVYAVLPAWGMHRMGSGGPKMGEFGEFKTSLEKLWPIVVELQQATPENLDEEGWRGLCRVFCELDCMTTKTFLVGHSKVMAHALPNLIPPVDREYTLPFLSEKRCLSNKGVVQEWESLKIILQHFFYPLLQTTRFKRRATEWQERVTEFRWDTSPLKIADNVVIGFQRARGQPTSDSNS